MDKKKASLILIVFALGWILSDVFSAIGSFDLEKPFSYRAKELPSPGDWIQEREIHVNKENIVYK